jgi:hypothetical protein
VAGPDDDPVIGSLQRLRHRVSLAGLLLAICSSSARAAAEATSLSGFCPFSGDQQSGIRSALGTSDKIR